MRVVIQWMFARLTSCLLLAGGGGYVQIECTLARAQCAAQGYALPTPEFPASIAAGDAPPRVDAAAPLAL